VRRRGGRRAADRRRRAVPRRARPRGAARDPRRRRVRARRRLRRAGGDGHRRAPHRRLALVARALRALLAPPSAREGAPGGRGPALLALRGVAREAGRVSCRVAVLASGGGTTFENLVVRSRDGRLGAEVVALAVSRANAFAETRAKRLGVACESIPAQLQR